MAAMDGNGWIQCRCGHRHWGRFGAAGLLLLRPGPDVLLQLRADWTHEGGTWGLLGGARDSHEDAVSAALREAHEEGGIEPDAVRVLSSVIGVDHGNWAYTYVVATAAAGLRAWAATNESAELRWVPVDAARGLPLHGGLSAAWPRLAPMIQAAISTA